MQDETHTQEDDQLLANLKTFLFTQYKPVKKQTTDVLLLSTAEIYRQLQRLYPNQILYSASDVAQWMNEAGFTFIDSGGLRIEWMLQKIQVD